MKTTTLKSFATLLIGTLLSAQLFATSLVADSFITSATWNVDTVFVYSDVNVTDTLIIAPGTQVLFSGYYSIMVNMDGLIEAISTPGNPIVFKPINGNEATGWAGIDFTAQMYTKPSTFSHCEFHYAFATGQSNNGGAIATNEHYDINIDNCLFKNCYAENNGGALYFNLSQAKVSNSFFTQNIADSHGSAIAAVSSDLWLTQSVLVNNGGNSLLLADGAEKTLYLYNNTIARNENQPFQFSSIALYAYNNIINSDYYFDPNYNYLYEAYFENNLLPNHQPPVNSNEISYLYYKNNLIGEPYFDYPAEGSGPSYDGTLYNWALLENSPAINAGLADTAGLNLPATDFEGNSRIYSGTYSRIDMGAFEYQFNGTSPQLVFDADFDMSLDQNGLTGPETGTPLFTPNYLPSRFANKAALAFDGTQSLTFNHSNEMVSNNQFTLSAWIKPQELLPETEYVLFSAASLGNEWKLALYNGSIKFSYWTGGTEQVVEMGWDSFFTNTWSLLTVMYDGAEIRFYKNATQIYSDYLSNWFDNYGSDLTIGSFKGTSNFYKGAMSDVRIYNQPINFVDQLYMEPGPAAEPKKTFNKITFSVNLSRQINQALFDPDTETVHLAGDFNGWDGTFHQLYDADKNGIYELLMDYNFPIGDTYNYKYQINNSWEGLIDLPEQPNRVLMVGDNTTQVYDCFNNDCLGTDLALLKLVSPVSGCGLTGSQPIQLVYGNAGSNVISGNIVVSYYDLVNGWSHDTIYGANLNPGATANYQTLGYIDVSTQGVHNLSVAVTYAGDEWPYNDSIQTLIYNQSYQSAPFTDNFETDNIWMVEGRNPSWQRGYPSNQAVSEPASGSYIWATNLTGDCNPDEESYLVSPCIYVSAAQAVAVRFKYSAATTLQSGVKLQYYRTSDSLWIDAYNYELPEEFNQGTMDLGEGSYNYHMGTNYQWRTALYKIDMPPSELKIRFKFVNKGSQTSAGFAIDDVEVFEWPYQNLAIVRTEPQSSPYHTTVYPGMYIKNYGLDLFEGNVNWKIQSDTWSTGDTLSTVYLNPFEEVFVGSDYEEFLNPVGVYNHTFTLSNNYGTLFNDTIYKAINHIGTVASYPYTETFEGVLDTLWYAYSDNPWKGQLWEQTTPGGSHLNTAYQGSYTMTTSPQKAMSSFEQAALYSPNFNTTSLIKPVVSFYVKRHLVDEESFVTFEYATDGVSWQPLMAENSVNWPTVQNLMGYGETAGWAKVQDNDWVLVQATLPTLAGLENLQFRFLANSGLNMSHDEGIAIDNFSVQESPGIDLSISKVLSPVVEPNIGSSPLSIQIQNYGLNAATAASYTLSYSINGAAFVTDAATPAVPGSGLATHTFAPTFDFSAAGVHTISVAVSSGSDANAYNDTLHFTFINQGLVSSLPYFDDFDGTATWISAEQNNVWLSDVPNGSKIPGAYSGNKALFTNLGDKTAPVYATFESPWFDFTGIARPAISFKLWKNQSYDLDAAATFQVSIDSGRTWQTYGNSDYRWFNSYHPVFNEFNRTDCWHYDSYEWETQVSLDDYETILADRSNVKFRLIYKANQIDTSISEGYVFDDFTVYDGTYDLAINKLTNPINRYTGPSETLSFEVENLGYELIDGLDIRVSVDGGAWVTETRATSLNNSDYMELSTTNTFDLSASGNHEIKLVVQVEGDGNPFNDTLVYTWYNPLMVSTFPYFDDFEGADQMQTGGQNNSWQLGAPAGSVINTAYSGSNAWITGLTTGYNANEVSYIETPIFDFTSVQNPVLSFYYWAQTDSLASFTLQASNSGGMYWDDFCENNMPNQEHCNYIIEYPNAPYFGINGQYGQWRKYTTYLPYGNQEQVQFRIYFSSAPDANTSFDGIAIDNFSIYDAQGIDLEIQRVEQYNMVELNAFFNEFHFEVFNYGNTDAYQIQLNYTVDGGDTIAEIQDVYFGSQYSNTIYPTQSINLSGYGPHMLKAWITATGDINPANDTINAVLFNAPGILVDSSHVFTFDEPQQWYVKNEWNTAYSSWERGIPEAGSLAQSENNIWKTGLGTQGGFRETSYLYSPGFSFKNLTFPVVEFDMFRDLGPEQLVQLQYFNMNEGYWANLGNIGDPGNWYTPYAPGKEELGYALENYNSANAGWTNYTDTGWMKANHMVEQLAMQEQVQFRIAYVSRNNWEGNQGFAFDNFKIYNYQPGNDVGILSVLSPTSGEVNANDTVRFVVKNNGLNPIDSLYVSVRLFETEVINQALGGLNIAPGEEREITLDQYLNLSEAGGYFFELNIYCPNDELVQNNYRSDEHLMKLVRIVVDQILGYHDSFEGDTLWQVTDDSTQWELGIPSATVINHASDSSMAWVTNLTGYCGFQKSEIISPIIDFSNIQLPMISFDKWSQTNPGNGATLMYTADWGKTWVHVRKGENWYNDDQLTIQTDEIGTYGGWSGKDTTWSRAIAYLPELAFHQGVVFRLIFSSEYEYEDVEGFAFDNFVAEEGAGDQNAAITGIIAERLVCASDLQSINVKVANVGLLPINNFNVVLNVPNYGADTLAVTTEMAPLDTILLTFDNISYQIAEEFKLPYTLTANTILAGDEMAINDTLRATVNVFNPDYVDMPGWRSFSVCDGFFGTGFFSIDQDTEGNIWYATMYGGVIKQNKDSLQVFGTAAYPGGDYSWALTAAPDGKVWWTSAQRPEINMYQNGVVTKYTPVPDVEFDEYIYAATNGDVWFADYDGGGLLRYNGTEFIYYPETKDQMYSSIGEMPDQTIVISTYDGKLITFNGTNFMPAEYQGEPIMEIFYDKVKNKTWFGGYNTLLMSDGENWIDHSTIIEQDGINDIDVDKYGNIWAVSNSNKAYMFNGSTWQVFTDAEGLAPGASGLYAVCGLTDGKIAFGSYGGGVSMYANGPVADFVFVSEELAVTFINQSFGSGLSYLYNFGDGKASTQPNPVHLYSKPGTYNVCLRITDNLQKESTICKKVTVSDSTQLSCFALFEYNIVNDTVYFINQSSTNSAQYYWEFGDNSSSTLKNPGHYYSTAGYYEVFLTVKDSSGLCFDNFSKVIYIEGAAETCLADFSYEINQKEVNFFNNSQGAVTNYLWSFGDGTFSSDSSVSHTFTENGLYEVCLTVYNAANDCMHEFCQTITILDSTSNVCIADYNYTVNDASVSFFAQTSSNITDYLWDFGDGTFSSEKNPVHTYKTPNFYKVKLTVYDAASDCLNSKIKTVIVTVGGQDLCNASFSSFTNGATVKFTNTSNGEDNQLFWSFGDGNYSTDSAPSHTYTKPNFYEVCLSIYNDETGCYDEVCNIIAITDVDVVICKADFDYYTQNTKVNFQGTVTGGATDYFWDFGDGNYSYEKSPSHTYNQAGYYNVWFNSYNDTTQCVAEKFQFVMVIDSTATACKADFEWHATGSKVNFINQSKGDYTDLFWDLGDGNYATDSAFAYTYAKSGYYGVALTMFNELNNCLDTYSDLVIVLDSTKNLCQADFTNYANNTTVTFTDQSTGEITDYFWDFGDGFYSVDANTTHTYASPGYYEVIQTVFNSTDNCMDDFSKVVKVVDTTKVMCKADFNFYPEGNSVSFTSQATGAFKQVFWDFGNGKISNKKNPVHTYSKPGYYNVTYTVVDTNTTCFDTKNKVVYVEGTLTPTYGEVSASFSHYPASDSLTVFFTDNSKGNVSKWYWDFGDNTPASNLANPTHKYSINDYYRVCQTVSNPEKQNTKCKFIPVGDVSTKNTAFFTYYADTLYATAYFQNKSLGDIVSYFWDFGDGITSEQKNPSHTYADTGYYAVCLSTTSSTGRVRSYCKDVRIGNSIENPCLFSCVWPGDANSDLEANHYDMLTIGLNYGMEGPFRIDASNAWYGQFAQNWSTYQIDGTNNKHGDCNGDGVINELDTVAISQNFAYSHYWQPDVKAAEWELTCVWDPEDSKAAGSRSRAKAILSPPLKKAAGDIYGIGYEIEVLNAQGVIWDSVYVSFDESWLGEEGTDMITFYTIDREKAMIYVSSVRKDHQNTSGSGSIATVHFVLEEGYSARSISFNVTTLGGIEAGGLAVGVGGGIMLNLGDDVSICEGEETTISAPEGFKTYAWSSGESTRSITVSAQGTYTLTVTDSLGTVASDAITLNVIANPVPVLGDDITTDTEVVLNTGGTFETYLWSTDETTPTITVTQSGKYWVEVSNSFGCTGSDTVYVSFVGINDYISQMETMTIHPNPNQGSFWLITENEMFGELRYELIDLQGKVILNKELPVKGKVRHLVHPEYLPQGMYYLKSYYNDEVKVIKVVVQ